MVSVTNSRSTNK